MTTTEPKNDHDFEASLKRLEAIVKEMESGDLSLEKMMAYFEEGTSLVKTCGATLNEVEKKIEQLVKRGDAVGTEPFPIDPGDTI